MLKLLDLARIYPAGLGKIWKNKSDASRVLAITYPKIRRAHISAGATLALLPNEVLELFEPVGIALWNVRALSAAHKTQGSAALLETAVKIKATNKNFSRATLVKMLCLSTQIPLSLSLEQQKFDPEELAQRYVQGLSDGRWSSLRSAQAVLGSTGNVAIACRYADLPKSIKILFIKESISYSLCVKVLALEKAYGRKTLVERAGRLCSESDMPNSVEEILCHLAGLTPQSATITSRLRIPTGQKKLIIELHCQDVRFTLDRSNQLIKLVEAGMASLIESALATLGAKPKI